MPKEIILDDLASREQCRSWSRNTWKSRLAIPLRNVLIYILQARLALNFKCTPYQTEWIPFFRLSKTLKSLYVE